MTARRLASDRRRSLPLVATALVVLAGLVVPGVEPSWAAPAVTVNSTGDAVDAVPLDGVCDTGVLLPGGDPECTLRAAIETANDSVVDTIEFAVPPTGPGGVATIAPATDLPALTAPVVVDGSTQPGWVDDPLVALDGTTTTGVLLDVAGGLSTVHALALHSAATDALLLRDAGTNLVTGTWVGLLPDGVTAAPAGGAGIHVAAGADGSTLGGLGAGEGNVVAGGTVGVQVEADDVVVTGNRIGTSADGTLPRGATGHGVLVDGAARALVAGNLIAHHGGAGVAVAGTADDAAVIGNSLVANTGLAIDLGDDGLTANDPGDGDSGPNDLLNTPVPTIATPTEVSFELDVPAGTYMVEVFRNPTEGADPLGSGEAEELVGSDTVVHPGGGPAAFTVAGLVGVGEGDVLSLTATEDIAGVAGSTSEVSATIVADDDVAVVNDGGDAPDADLGDATCDTGGPLVAGAPACTLRAALQQAAASVIDTIRIAVPATDPHVSGGVLTITPGSALPAVATGTTVDGTTQAGWAGDPVVALDGALLPGDLLTVAGDGVTVTGIALHGAGGDGIAVTGADVLLEGVWVGLRPDGTVDGTGGAGVHVDDGTGVLLTGSRIVGSALDGVAVTGSSDDVAVVDTTVRANGDLAIDLGDDGVTPNDPDDLDTGPNGLLNRPVVTGTSVAGGTVTLDVMVQDVAAGDLLLQVFTTPVPDPSGAGEGDVLVHSTTVTHGGGTVVHPVSFAGDADATHTVTLTEDLGGGAFGATSEFSDTATRPVATDDPVDVASGIAAASPIAWWRLGEATGTTAVDDGSAGVDGTHVGGVGLGAAGALVDDADTAVDLDGGDDVVVVPHDPALLLDVGTVALWVRLDDLSVTRTPFSKDATGLGTGGHVDLRVEPDGTVVHRLGSSTGEVEVASSPGAVTAGTWHHLAATFGPRGTELWVDGRRVDADPWTGGWGTTSGGAGNSEPITLGASSDGSAPGSATPTSAHVDGGLDEVAVFGTQLDGATIAALAGGAAQRFTVEAGDTLTVPAAAGVLATDHDADGDTLTATLVTGPTHAAAFSLLPDGSFTYTPDGTLGLDTFTYTAGDGGSTSSPATVTVLVEPGRGDRVITDSTGNGHEGVPSGAMTSGDAVTGRIGGALDLDGVDDRIEVTNLDVAGDRLTLSAWIDPDGFGTDPSVLAKGVGLADVAVEWRLLVDDTSPVSGAPASAVRTGAGLVGTTSPGTIGTGWVHVVARYDGSTITLFVDGVAVASAAHSGALRPDPTVPVWIGDAPTGGRPFDGRIDEVRVSSSARSDAWIAAEHATQDDPAAAVSVGAVETSPATGWTTTSAQARSGSSSAEAPTGALRSWLTLDGTDEVGFEAVSWWRVTSLPGLDVAQGVRAGDAAGAAPVRQVESSLTGPSGWDLGRVDGSRTQLLAPPAGQSPLTDTWQRVVVRVDQDGDLSATVPGSDLPVSGAVPGGGAGSGTFGLRAGLLGPTQRWWVDDLRLRRYVSPEPVATVARTELAP